MVRDAAIAPMRPTVALSTVIVITWFRLTPPRRKVEGAYLKKTIK